MAITAFGRRRYLVAAAAILVLLVAGVAAFVQVGAERPEYCNGVHRELGGCDDDQPAFIGRTCEQVGLEFGSQLNQREVAILRGPDVVNGQRRSARISATEILLTARANQHLREIGIVADCGVEEFLAAAESEFSDELRSGVGTFLSELTDLQEQTYDDWRANLKQTLSVIDMDEDSSIREASTSRLSEPA